LKSKPPSPNPFLLDRRQGKKFKVLLHFHWFLALTLTLSPTREGKATKPKLH
jgi:hypothetical protein